MVVNFFEQRLQVDHRGALKLAAVFYLTVVVAVAWALYLTLWLIAPTPRPPLPSEKKYRYVESDGNVSAYEELPCWYDAWDSERKEIQKRKQAEERRLRSSVAFDSNHRVVNQQFEKTRKEDKEKLSLGEIQLEKAQCFISLVVPAFNEAERLGIMLKEAVEVLEVEYGSDSRVVSTNGSTSVVENGETNTKRRKGYTSTDGNQAHNDSSGNGTSTHNETGYEILIVSDGSTDATVTTALNFVKQTLKSNLYGSSQSGRKLNASAKNIRVIELAENRGKGGAVTHGLRHVRGEYAIFADADGASTFSDVTKLVTACKEAAIQDDQRHKSRAVAVGSRAHLVGSEAVVQRSLLRNTLMHSFHLLLRLLTPPRTARIKDTQCGFKLFSRASLPYIIPHMHSESWIFDVEMLMLAEMSGIPMVEVPIGWHEVKGSKLNIIKDSIGMAIGLGILRAAWGLGVYVVEE